MAVWCKITPLRANFQSSLINVQKMTAIDVFIRISCRSVYSEMRVHGTRYKTPPFSPLFCAPLAQGAIILTREIGVWPTYACKILSGSIKICRSYSRKANFEQIHIMLSCICMTA